MQMRDFASSLECTAEQLALAAALWPVVHAAVTLPAACALVDDVHGALCTLFFAMCFLAKERFGECGERHLAAWTSALVGQGFLPSPPMLALVNQTVVFHRSALHANVIPVLVKVLAQQPNVHAWALAQSLLTPNDDALAFELAKAFPQALLVQGIKSGSHHALQCAVQLWSSPGVAVADDVDVACALCDLLLASDANVRALACDCIAALCACAPEPVVVHMATAGCTAFIAGLMSDDPLRATHALFALVSAAPAWPLMGHLNACMEPCCNVLSSYAQLPDQTYVEALGVIQVGALLGDVTASQATRLLAAISAFADMAQAMPAFQPALAATVSAIGVRSFDAAVHAAAGQVLGSLAPRVLAQGLPVLVNSLVQMCEYAPQPCLCAVADVDFIQRAMDVAPEATFQLVARMLHVASASPLFTHDAVRVAAVLQRAKFAQACMAHTEVDAAAHALHALCATRLPSEATWDWPVVEFAGTFAATAHRAWTTGSLPCLAALCMCVLEVAEPDVDVEVVRKAFDAALLRGTATSEQPATLAMLYVLVQASAPEPTNDARLGQRLRALVKWDSVAEALAACTVTTRCAAVAWAARHALLDFEALRCNAEAWGAEEALCVVFQAAPRALEGVDWHEHYALVPRVLHLLNACEDAVSVLRGLLNNQVEDAVEVAHVLAVRARELLQGQRVVGLSLDGVAKLCTPPAALSLRAVLCAMVEWPDVASQREFFDSDAVEAALACAHVDFIACALRVGAVETSKAAAVLTEVACKSANADKRATCAEILVEHLPAHCASTPTTRIRVALLGDVVAGSVDQRWTASRALALTSALEARPDAWMRVALERLGPACFTDVGGVLCQLVAVLERSVDGTSEWRACEHEALRTLDGLNDAWSALRGALCVLLAVVHVRAGFAWASPEALDAVRRSSMSCALAAMRTGRSHAGEWCVGAFTSGLQASQGSVEWSRACRALVVDCDGDPGVFEAPLCAMETCFAKSVAPAS